MQNNGSALHTINYYHYPTKFAIFFKTREEYLEWVRVWKEEYKPLAARQVTIRKVITQPHEKREHVDEWRRKWCSYYVGDQSVSNLQSEKMANRWRLRWLLEKRKTAKDWSKILKQRELEMKE